MRRTLFSLFSAWFCFFILFCVSLQGSAQPPVVCNSSVVVSVDQNCEATLTPDMILEAMQGSNSDYSIQVFSGSGPIATGTGTVTIPGVGYIGQTLAVSVTEISSSNTCFGNITLEDGIAPSALCNSPLAVNIPASGSLTLSPSFIDAGSADNCGNISMEIGLTPGTLGPDLTLTCSNAGLVTVFLRVTDGSGNSAICFSQVVVAPCALCPLLDTAPPDVSIVNSICTGCTASGGSIAAPAGSPCPAGSTLEYRVNGGGWSATLPVFEQEGPPQTIVTRCVCDTDITIASPESAGVTTAPDLCNLFTLVLQPDGSQGKDAPVSSFVPNNNYSANSQLTAHKWTIGGVWYTTRSYLDFDWSALPANASIISAELGLTGATGTFNQYLYPCLQGPNDLYLTLVSDPWDESTITWNNKPGTSSDPLHRVNVPAICTPGGNLSADVTQLVQAILSGNTAFHGFELRLQQEAPNQYRAYSAYSSDHTDPAARPRMILEYSLVWYADTDGDGFGDPNVSLTTCAQPVGYVADNTDCDDTDPDVFPGVMVITCPASVPPLQAVSNCQSALEDYTGLAAVSGTCSLPLNAVVQTPPPGTLVSNYLTPVTLSVTNAAGQSASCTFTVIKEGCGNFPWEGN